MLYVAPVWQRMREGGREGDREAAGRLAAAAEGQGRPAAKCPYP